MTQKHIGIAACSFEGASLCYRTICLEAEAILGEWNHPRVTLDSIPMAAFMPAFHEKRYDDLAAILRDSIEVLAKAGADFAICPDNSCHLALPYLGETAIPFLSILDVVAGQAADKGYRNVAIIGTKFTMQSDMYPKALAKYGINATIPTAVEQDLIDDAIFSELVKGEFFERTRIAFGTIIERMAGEGCDAAALVCTEIPLLVREPQAVPLLDSSRLLAKAALTISLA